MTFKNLCTWWNFSLSPAGCKSLFPEKGSEASHYPCILSKMTRMCLWEHFIRRDWWIKYSDIVSAQNGKFAAPGQERWAPQRRICHARYRPRTLVHGRAWGMWGRLHSRWKAGQCFAISHDLSLIVFNLIPRELGGLPPLTAIAHLCFTGRYIVITNSFSLFLAQHFTG